MGKAKKKKSKKSKSQDKSHRFSVLTVEHSKGIKILFTIVFVVLLILEFAVLREDIQENGNFYISLVIGMPMLLLSLYEFLYSVVWKIDVKHDDITIRNMMGISKTYTCSDITKIVSKSYEGGSNTRIYIGDKVVTKIPDDFYLKGISGIDFHIWAKEHNILCEKVPDDRSLIIEHSFTTKVIASLLAGGTIVMGLLPIFLDELSISTKLCIFLFLLLIIYLYVYIMTPYIWVDRDNEKFTVKNILCKKKEFLISDVSRVVKNDSRFKIYVGAKKILTIYNTRLSFTFSSQCAEDKKNFIMWLKAHKVLVNNTNDNKECFVVRPSNLIRVGYLFATIIWGYVCYFNIRTAFGLAEIILLVLFIFICFRLWDECFLYIKCYPKERKLVISKFPFSCTCSLRDINRCKWYLVHWRAREKTGLEIQVRNGRSYKMDINSFVNADDFLRMLKSVGKA